MLVGKTKANSGKAKAAGNFIFKICNNKKTNGKEMMADTSQDAKIK